MEFLVFVPFCFGFVVVLKFYKFYYFNDPIFAGSKKLVKLLMSKGADLNAVADCGTPLLAAAFHGNKDCVEVLLDGCVDVRKSYLYLILSPKKFEFCYDLELHNSAIYLFPLSSVVHGTLICFFY